MLSVAALNQDTANGNKLPQGNIVTRSVLVSISGSLANLGMQGSQAAIWKIVDGSQSKVFGLGSSVDAQVATNQLRTALIHEVHLLEHRSTFPVPMGAKIECVPDNEKIDMGEGYAYTVLPHSVISSPHTLYKCDVGSEEGQQWRKDYPKYNSANIDKEGIIEVNNCPYVFVHQDHPVIAVLRANAALIGCSIDEQPKIDNEWYKVTRQVLSSCCDALRSQVLNKVASNDLNLFQVQLFRLNADNWDSISDVSLPLQNFIPDSAWSAERIADEQRKHIERFLSVPYTYMARLQIKYEIQAQA